MVAIQMCSPAVSLRLVWSLCPVGRLGGGSRTRQNMLRACAFPAGWTRQGLSFTVPGCFSSRCQGPSSRNQTSRRRAVQSQTGPFLLAPVPGSPPGDGCPLLLVSAFDSVSLPTEVLLICKSLSLLEGDIRLRQVIAWPGRCCPFSRLGRARTPSSAPSLWGLAFCSRGGFEEA